MNNLPDNLESTMLLIKSLVFHDAIIQLEYVEKLCFPISHPQKLNIIKKL